jgi:hypothetical protein
MFTWLNKQGVKSSKGFIVQCVTRFTFEYKEDKKIISIPVESDLSPELKLIIKANLKTFSKWLDRTTIS